jgi:LPS export ABC transporter permease LptG/LPS export ABC transporter permease LptF
VRLIGRYIFREILTSSLLGTLLATFVIFLHGADGLLKLLVGTNPPPATVATLLALALPPVLPFTIPFGVLVGILIGLGRLSADGEIVAMRAAGVSSRKVIAPVLTFALLGTGLAAWASLRLTPYSYRVSAQIVAELAASRSSADVQPQVFIEDFPNTILYADAVKPGPPGAPVLWERVFIADTTPPDERKKGIAEKADGPLITTARYAIATSDPKNNRVLLELHGAATHEMGKDLISHDHTATLQNQALNVKPPEQTSQRPREMTTRQLLHYKGSDILEAAIELHQRFTFPVACVMLALVGIPLGIATRKGGKSAAYLIALFLGFFCYWLSSIALQNVAKQRTLPVPVAIWLPNAIFGIAGVVFVSRMEKPGDRDVISFLQAVVAVPLGWFKPRIRKKKKEAAGLPFRRIPILPQLIDTYILSNFLFYFGVILAALISMFLVFNFFELTGDMIRNNISLRTMFTYLFFLTPMYIYILSPLCVLIAVLANLGVLSKQNEVTAFRACGVSLFRLSVPILLVSVLFSGGLFAFDYYRLPGANRRQDKLRDQIKNRPTQTYYRADRKWTLGKDFRIYYYALFDPAKKEMADANVYEIEPHTFQVVKQIRADRSHWSEPNHTWVFENGWSNDIRGGRSNRADFTAQTFEELVETPSYFLQEYHLYTQMNFLELDQYIQGLMKSGYGYNTVSFEIQLDRKFAVPLSALIMAMIGVPFGFLVGNRGALTGIGVAIAIALSYLATSALFQKVGEINELTPAIAAWGPDAIFALAGMYFLLRMKS